MSLKLTYQEHHAIQRVLSEFNLKNWPSYRAVPATSDISLILYRNQNDEPKAEAVHKIGLKAKVDVNLTPATETPEQRMKALEHSDRSTLEILCQMYYPKYHADGVPNEDLILDILEAEQKQKLEPVLF